MTYRSGLFGSDPEIICNTPGCTARVVILAPYAWFMANRPPPGWSLERTETDDGVNRIDLCPQHREETAK